MPLSEEELRLLEQMERALVEEDPKLASTLRGTSLRRTARRRAILAGACFLLGIAVMMSGAITETWPLGIAGFVIMLGSATMALTALRGGSPSGGPTGQEGRTAEPAGRGGFTLLEGGRSRRRSPRTRHDSSGSFMERMAERGRRRRDERGGF